jgi:hypothetical protein
VTHEACHGRGGFAWIGLYKPTEERFSSDTVEFELEYSKMVEISRRTYEGSREVLPFYRATQPPAKALKHFLKTASHGL